MNKKLAILFLFFGLSLQAQTAFQKGEQLFEEEQWEAAKAEFNKISSTESDYLKAQEYLGDIASQQKNWDEATNIYEELVEAKPNNANYNYKYGGALGMKALSLTKVEAAFYISDIKEYLKNAAELDDNHVGARWALVKLYMQLPGILGGSEDTSYQYAEELQHISEVDGWLAKGYIAEEAEDFQKAENYYKNAVEVGQSVTCYQKLINLYQEKTQEADKAEKWIQLAKAKHPETTWED